MNKNPNSNRVLTNSKNVVNHNNNVRVTPEPQNEAIMDKLHGGLNALRLRRERHENHRRKDFVME